MLVSYNVHLFFVMTGSPRRLTRTDTPVPYTALLRVVLGVAAGAGDGGDALAGHALQALGDGLEGDAPGHRLEAAGAVAQIRTIEPLARQAVTGMARLVVDQIGRAHV